MLNLDHGMKVERLAHYQSEAGSLHHLTKYKKWSKLLAHRVECALLHRLLQRVGHSRDIFDAPTGPGRFFEILKQHADEVHLGDISPHMLDIARAQTQNRAASYTVVDLLRVAPESRTFEGMTSLRLTHHIYEPEVIEEYFRGLSILTRRWLIVTFRDAHTPSTIWRRFGRRLRGKRNLPAQSIDEVCDIMRPFGLHLVTTEHVCRWFSGHCYALFVRNPDGSPTE
ncbi:MAG: methyltransferase domain-containing protein [Candidatus Hydrogenedentales bacterium]|jgi:SAM-dependent methyltransferase